MKTLKTIGAISLVAVACAALKPSTDTKTSDQGTDQAKTAIKTETETVAIANPGGPDTSKWVAPAEADQVKNPVEANEESIAEGMAVFKRNCRSCHGRAGDGAGVGAADCTTPPTNFLTDDFKKQTDGAIHWKISTGRNDMKPYKDELDDEEIWKVIIYIKSLKPSE